jgi:RES domain
MPLEMVASPGTLHRVGRWPHPFVWRTPRIRLADSAHPHDGHRWDAPNADFATLYCASNPLASFVETLAYYRRADGFANALWQATDEDDPDPEYDFQDTGGGRVPSAYFERVLGRATLDSDRHFVDVDHPRTHAQLTAELPGLLAEHGYREFDRGVMMTQDRRITRQVADHLHQQAGTTGLSGIRYESRIQRGLECWALWDECAPELTNVEVDPLTPETPEIKQAADLLQLQLPQS